MASSSLLLEGVQLVETAEVVDAVAALLSGSDFGAYVAYGPEGYPDGGVHAHRVAGDGARAAMYCVVREMGGRRTRETPSGMLTVHVQVVVSVDAEAAADAGETGDRVLSYAHVLAHRALEGAMLDGGEGDGRFQSTGPVHRPDTPSPAVADDRTGGGPGGRLLSSAVYTVPVRPVLAATTPPLPTSSTVPDLTSVAGITAAQAASIARAEADAVVAAAEQLEDDITPDLALIYSTAKL